MRSVFEICFEIRLRRWLAQFSFDVSLLPLFAFLVFQICSWESSYVIWFLNVFWTVLLYIVAQSCFGARCIYHGLQRPRYHDRWYYH